MTDPAATAALTADAAAFAAQLGRRFPAREAGAFVRACVATLLIDDLERAPPGPLAARWTDAPADTFVAGLAGLWARLDVPLLRAAAPLPLAADELALLRALAGRDRSGVSPTVLGALLERSLDAARRRRLGAHYTPEAYVERLVDRTIAAPLRAEWERVRVDADPRSGRAFHRRLADVRVLDPACGGGNLLVAALRALLRLEDDVVAALGEPVDGPRVGPAQCLGLDIDPAAAEVAACALWLTFLRARPAMRGVPDRFADLGNIRVGDALVEPGVGGRAVAAWPAADFIVGNPPFVGNKRMRDVLDPGRAAALRAAYPEVPASADLAMVWWWRCAALLRAPAATRPLRRFGLVVPSSVTQPLNRAVVEAALAGGVRLVYAIADHPWFDAGAAVRIAMTVAGRDDAAAALGVVVDERAATVVDTPVAAIHADLSSGTDPRRARVLRANAGLCFQGITLVGAGFRLGPADLARLGVPPTSPALRPYLIGRDLVRRPQARWVVDLAGLTRAEAEARHPALYAHLARTVQPQRAAQSDRHRREHWWLFGRSGAELRAALARLPTYIATARTARHRVFTRVPATTLPDTKIVAIASDDPAVLAVLSSRVHLAWALRVGGRLGVGNDPTYNHRDCFDRFPFPAPTPTLTAALRRAGERLDDHRKARQAADPTLTLTGMYNVLEKLRAGAALDDRDRDVRARALVDALAAIHDEVDRLTLAAYGWPADLGGPAVLARLVDLNGERAAEEDRGVLRRPGAT